LWYATPSNNRVGYFFLTSNSDRASKNTSAHNQ
jgi:hypothetical protein